MGKWIGIGLALFGVLALVFIVAAYLFPDFREATRDIAIVILALFQLIGAILTIALLLAVLYAVQMIRRLTNETVMPKIEQLSGKIDQVLEQAHAITGDVKETSATVSTTTAYVAERVVSPVIRIGSLVAGVRAAATFLARRGE